MDEKQEEIIIMKQTKEWAKAFIEKNYCTTTVEGINKFLDILSKTQERVVIRYYASLNKWQISIFEYIEGEYVIEFLWLDPSYNKGRN
jgi:hypothetical protein